MDPLFPGFDHHRVPVAGARIAVRVGGSGPGLLLLHGYPQTGAMWHRVAPALAEQFTVVVPDLRGYGASSKPSGRPGGQLYSKRLMAADQVAVMDALGWDSFAVAGHDRGARVTHRMALDHPERVRRAAVLDIVPTRHVFATADEQLARAYYHWFFLSQPYDLPERLIAADPEYYLKWCLRRWSATPDCTDPAALAEYLTAFRDPATIHASCEDYRAGAGVDLDDDGADPDARITCPLLVLWGSHGFVHRRYDVLDIWRRHGQQVEGHDLPCGHFLPEESPAETLAALQAFFARD